MSLDFANWFLVFVRIGAFLLALPFFSAVNFPPTMRVALAALASLLLAPQLPPFPIAHLGLLALFGLLVRETLVGLLLGFFARMVFYAADNDFPADPSRDKIDDSYRVYPGDGVYPVADVLRLLRDTGGQRVLSLEVFNGDYWKQDALKVAKTGLAKMKKVVAAAE